MFNNSSCYLSLSTKELSALPDKELINAALLRTENRVSRFGSLRDGINTLSDSQKIFYVLVCFQTEVDNGGLCQFFVNSTRALAPFISDYLDIIGADRHKTLFDEFTGKYGIDLRDLSSFAAEDKTEYKKQTGRCPFDEFDKAFYSLEPLYISLTGFVRKHISEF